MRIAATLNDLGVAPHLVAVSTCYVAGNRRGLAPEELVSAGPWDVGLNWRSEVSTARRMRSDAEAASQLPPQLAEFRHSARRELGAAGAPALAAKTESLRETWVRDQLVEAGRARAASVGWPDAYAFTKALGEQALTDTKGAVPVSIVRPSIIESALAEPNPGWIRGFRMAEPVIISYARGMLSQFPGNPEGTIDVIPVDIVVDAIIAVAALGPERAPAITHVASGSTNPLHYRLLIAKVQEWFSANPLYDADGQPIVLPEFRFPGRGKVEGQLRRAKSLMGKAEGALQQLPLRGKQATLAAKLEERKADVERALQYVELYGLYTLCEAVYSVDNLLAVQAMLPPEDRQTFELDPRAVDWATYITEIHLPSIVTHARVKTTPGKTRTDRSARLDAPSSPRAPRGRVRPGEHADRQQRGGELLVPRHPAARRAGAGALPGTHAGRGAAPAVARPPGPRRLPAALLPPLRGRPDRPDRGGLGRAVHPAGADEELPRRHPSVRRHAPSGTGPC